MAHARVPRANAAWMNHYFVKSAEEFLWKWSRNRGDLPFIEQSTTEVLTADYVRHFMAQHDAATDPSPTREGLAAQRMAPSIDAEIARLSALPGVGPAAAAVKENFRMRICGLVEMFADAAGILEARDVGARFLDLFRKQI